MHCHKRIASWIVLERTPLSHEVKASQVIAPTGWLSDDILQDVFSLPTTRAPLISDLLNEALKLISQGLAGNMPQLKTVATSLSSYIETLPPEDVARDIIRAILKTAKVRYREIKTD